MISKHSDRAFKRWLDSMEHCYPILLADRDYGPIMRARGAEEELRQARIEWRERQERARARRLRWEASMSEG